MGACRSPLFVLAGLVLVVSAASSQTEPPMAALERAADLYRQSPRLAERLEYTVHFPDGRTDRKAIEYGRADDRLFVTMLDAAGTRVFHISVGEGRLRALQFNIGGGYVESSFEGSLIDAFVAIGADRIGITVPPSLAASEERAGAFVESFGFGVIQALRPTSVEARDGITSVTMTGDAGTAVAKLDATTGRLAGLALTLGEGEAAVRFDGIVEPILAPADDERWEVAISGRRPVATFAALEAAGYPLGSSAPDLDIPALGGEVVSLAAMQGRVVILDFWATWCVPCWSALEHLERVAAWAESSGRPISVWAVSTAEQTTTFDEQVALASEFLAGRGLDVPVLVDVDGSFFTGMHTPGLPSTVLIAPDGTLARYHSGFGEDMEEVLRTEALELLVDR